jgi:hypothetical protein
MGGGMLMAYFECGPLSAHFNAWADFLMNFSPFHYQASIDVSIGVEFSLDLWICTIHISADINATLDLHGPPFGGVVSCCSQFISHHEQSRRFFPSPFRFAPTNQAYH